MKRTILTAVATLWVVSFVLVKNIEEIEDVVAGFASSVGTIINEPEKISFFLDE